MKQHRHQVVVPAEAFSARSRHPVLAAARSTGCAGLGVRRAVDAGRFACADLGHLIQNRVRTRRAGLRGEVA
jgi:hypothetical protein